jgi:HK97 family phage portal protein
MILATREGTNVRTTFGEIGIPPRPPAMAGGQTVTHHAARGVPAVNLAVRIAAQSVAVLDLGVFRGTGQTRERVSTGWRARLFAEPPNGHQTWFEVKETIEESLSFRGNAFVWKTVDPATSQVVELWALHPDQVAPRMDAGRLVWRVTVGRGFVDPVGQGDGVYTVGPETILHIRGHGGGGAMLAPSPIELHRRTIGAALAKIAHEATTYERGASIGLAVTYPETMTPEKARAWRDLWRETYEGPQNAGRTAVLGGGASIQRIGLSMTDTQFVEAMQFGVEEVARIFNVQPSLLGVQRSDRPLSPEHEEDRWLRYGLGPRLARIEQALRADPQLFGPGSRVYPRFLTEDVVRGDLITEDAIAHQQIQDGRLMPDEWRIPRGLPPLPNGLGMIPQIVPVGGAPNPPQPAQDTSGEE